MKSKLNLGEITVYGEKMTKEKWYMSGDGTETIIPTCLEYTKLAVPTSSVRFITPSHTTLWTGLAISNGDNKTPRTNCVSCGAPPRGNAVECDYCGREM